MSDGSIPRPSAYVSSRVVSVVANASGRFRIASRSAIGPSTLVPSASTPAESIGAPSDVSIHCPTELKCSSANPGGSMILWQDAQPGFLRCDSSCSLTVFGAASLLLLLLSSSVGTFGGGGAGGVSSEDVRVNLPRKPG